MAFTREQKLAYYRAHPELRRELTRRYRATKKGRETGAAVMRRYRAREKRRAEIQAAKDVLLSAHRLRLIGVRVASAK